MKPCKRGHTAGRYKAGNCIECAKASAAAWYRENPEKAKQRSKEYHIKNADAAIKRAALWNKANKERRREITALSYRKNIDRAKQFRTINRDILAKRKKAHHLKNKEEINAKARLWKKINNRKVNAINAARRGKVRGAAGKFNRKDVDALLIAQLGKCAICSEQMSDYHIDHVIPVSRGGSNWPSNLQLLCPPCNLSKGATVTLDKPLASMPRIVSTYSPGADSLSTALESICVGPTLP